MIIANQPELQSRPSFCNSASLPLGGLMYDDDYDLVTVVMIWQWLRWWQEKWKSWRSADDARSCFRKPLLENWPGSNPLQARCWQSWWWTFAFRVRSSPPLAITRTCKESLNLSMRNKAVLLVWGCFQIKFEARRQFRSLTRRAGVRGVSLSGKCAPILVPH